MKYRHFHPPGTSFCSTYTEILTFSLSGGDFYYTFNEISIFSPSQNVFLLCVYWNINILTLQRWLWPHPGTPQKYSRSSRAWKSNLFNKKTKRKHEKHRYLFVIFEDPLEGTPLLACRRWLLLHVYWNINIFTLPERLFALRIMKY